MYDLNISDFNKLLTTYRKSRGFTLESLGNKIGKTKATVSKYENGEIIPDILTVLEICNVLDISLSQLFTVSSGFIKSSPHNPFNTNKLYLYYYTENILITSILELLEETNKIFVKLYNGIKDTKAYANETSYYYEGTLECDRTVGYINLYNPTSQGTQLEKLQISFTIPWSKDFKVTNFFILALTPNSVPIVKKGIISTIPLEDISIYQDNLQVSKVELADMQKNNAWILENKNYDYYFYKEQNRNV